MSGELLLIIAVVAGVVAYMMWPKAPQDTPAQFPEGENRPGSKPDR